jgi:hypothetical protein
LALYLKKEAPPGDALCEADAGTRTPDPFITSEVLYQLSYVGAAMDASDVAVCSEPREHLEQRLAVTLAERRPDPLDLDQLLQADGPGS